VEKTRVIVVDDEPLFRELLRTALSTDPGIDVVGVAGDGESAVLMARREKPDVVIMTSRCRGAGRNRGGAANQERETTDGVVILSAHNERRYVTSLPWKTCRDGDTS